MKFPDVTFHSHAIGACSLGVSSNNSCKSSCLMCEMIGVKRWRGPCTSVPLCEILVEYRMTLYAQYSNMLQHGHKIVRNLVQLVFHKNWIPEKAPRAASQPSRRPENSPNSSELTSWRLSKRQSWIQTFDFARLPHRIKENQGLYSLYIYKYHGWYVSIGFYWHAANNNMTMWRV